MAEKTIAALAAEGKEEHPRAKLTDREIAFIAELVEGEIASGKRPMEAYRGAAARFEKLAR